MAAARPLSLSASFFVLVLAGCSGAGDQDLFDRTGQNDQNDTSATTPAPSSAKPTTPAPAPAKDAGPDPAPEPAKCTQEVEPNDDISQANTFTTSFCGKIDTPKDIDFARFVVPADATTLAFTHDEKAGKVAYRFFLNGVPLPVQGDSLRAIPGATYSVQMKPASGGNPGDRPTYQLNVTFDGK